MKLTPKQIGTIVEMDRFLVWNVELTAERALQVAAALDKDPGSPLIWGIVNEINQAIPVISAEEDNPNNGHMHHLFKIGREYSRVIYVSIATAYLKSVMDDAAIETALRGIAARTRADEFSIRRDVASIECRFWWD